MATNSPEKTPSVIVPAILVLGSLAVVAAMVIAMTHQNTRDRIAKNEREFMLRGLNELVPQERYDNDLFTDVLHITDQEMLGSANPIAVYRARSAGTPVAAILAPIAPNGYSGPIALLVAINYDGGLIGVRISSHKETPGLGDNIDTDKSDWIFSFDGRRIGNPPAVQWNVEKEGGYFDQFTGATITPRAVVIAVYNALLYFDNNRDLVFSESEKSETTG